MRVDLWAGTVSLIAESKKERKDLKKAFDVLTHPHDDSNEYRIPRVEDVLDYLNQNMGYCSRFLPSALDFGSEVL
jgi:hypothetical protein